MKLAQQIAQQRSLVEQFESVLQDILEPPKYAPPASEPLTYLQNLLATAESESDRREKLAAAEAALDHARTVLSDLEAQQSAIDLEAAATAARSELQQVANEINELSQQLSAKGAELLELVDRHRATLYAEQPKFRLEGQANLNNLPAVELSAAGVAIGRMLPVFIQHASPFA